MDDGRPFCTMTASSSKKNKDVRIIFLSSSRKLFWLKKKFVRMLAPAQHRKLNPFRSEVTDLQVT